jgi:uncharacterized protein with GYD domain
MSLCFVMGGEKVYFIGLAKAKGKPPKDSDLPATMDRFMKGASKMGLKVKGMYLTLGRYDFVGIFEAPDEKVAMKGAMSMADVLTTETLVAIPVEEAMKLFG